MLKNLKSIKDVYICNASKPRGLLGRKFIRHMNKGHVELWKWGFSHVDLKSDELALDIGCGGGVNVETLLKKCSRGRADGIDISDTSIRMSRSRLSRHLGKRCNIYKGSAEALPFSDESYTLVTAFETVYYWPNLVADFAEVCRVLKPRGRFLIVCEDNDPQNEVTKRIPGMRIYTAEELKNALEDAGFLRIDIDEKCSWVTAVAYKE